MTRYTINNNNKSITFNAEPLNIKTCLRLVKIMEANKSVKGFYVDAISLKNMELESMTLSNHSKFNIELLHKYNIKQLSISK